MTRMDGFDQRFAEAVAREEADQHQRRIIERIDQANTDMGFTAQAHCVPSVYTCGGPGCQICPER